MASGSGEIEEFRKILIHSGRVCPADSADWYETGTET